METEDVLVQKRGRMEEGDEKVEKKGRVETKDAEASDARDK